MMLMKKQNSLLKKKKNDTDSYDDYINQQIEKQVRFPRRLHPVADQAEQQRWERHQRKNEGEHLKGSVGPHLVFQPGPAAFLSQLTGDKIMLFLDHAKRTEMPGRSEQVLPYKNQV